MDQKLIPDKISKLIEYLINLQPGPDYWPFRQSIVDDLVLLGLSEERAKEIVYEMVTAYEQKLRNTFR